MVGAELRLVSERETANNEALLVLSIQFIFADVQAQQMSKSMSLNLALLAQASYFMPPVTRPVMFRTVMSCSGTHAAICA